MFDMIVFGYITYAVFSIFAFICCVSDFREYRTEDNAKALRFATISLMGIPIGPVVLTAATIAFAGYSVATFLTWAKRKVFSTTGIISTTRAAWRFDEVSHSENVS